MRLGYFRAGRDGASKQDLQALEAANCDQILIDTAPGSRSKTLHSRLADLKTGDELVVVRLSHLVQMPALLDLLADLVARGIIVQSLADRLRTTDPGVSATVMSLGRYQVRLATGGEKRRGRKPVMDAADVERARQMVFEEKVPVTQVASTLGVSRSTLYRHLPGI